MEISSLNCDLSFLYLKGIFYSSVLALKNVPQCILLIDIFEINTIDRKFVACLYYK